MDIDIIITTYNIALAEDVSKKPEKDRRRKKPGSLNLFSTSLMRGEI